MNGKATCKILKEIRQEIARQNDIEYVVTECRHQGDCKGTCPKCEEEVHYLEKQLEKRRASGKAVLVAGLAASLMVTATGCSAIKDFLQRDPEILQGDVPYSAGEEVVFGEVPDESSCDEIITEYDGYAPIEAQEETTDCEEPQ